MSSCFAIGSRTANVVPRSELSTSIRPPARVTMPCTIARPSPVPIFFVVKNGSKMNGMISFGIPLPVSLIPMRTS